MNQDHQHNSSKSFQWSKKVIQHEGEHLSITVLTVPLSGVSFQYWLLTHFCILILFIPWHFASPSLPHCSFSQVSISAGMVTPSASIQSVFLGQRGQKRSHCWNFRGAQREGKQQLLQHAVLPLTKKVFFLNVDTLLNLASRIWFCLCVATPTLCYICYTEAQTIFCMSYNIQDYLRTFTDIYYKQLWQIWTLW